eukprot:Protomagalhaensia_sp_Gyna_25__1847@NODE_197_length_4503_cov_25_391129_g152_i0_p3_GENE_NODE_197_length_4503_cov_25_391129_g152_i0NODE_197_length_4503_cov_25_391129_g152_i0_p3_ORF_typecomplete_len247_score27_81NdhM/PF10664_9/0_31_NODE_197_length_4503_cov_25_391129_g152_i025193259
MNYLLFLFALGLVSSATAVDDRRKLTRRGDRASTWEPTPVPADAPPRLQSPRDLVQQLNLTLEPPENRLRPPPPRGSGSLDGSDELQPANSWADESADFAKQVMGSLMPGLAGGGVPVSLLRKVTHNLEKRKAKTLEQSGIQYDMETTVYRNPLGLPCDPRVRPLLCTLDEEYTSTSTTRPSLIQQARQMKAERASSLRPPAVTTVAPYNPFVDGPRFDDPTPHSEQTEDFVIEPTSSFRRRRKAK